MIIVKGTNIIDGTVEIDLSKSESNRLLMISAYGGFASSATLLSPAADTRLLSELLSVISQPNSDETIVDCRDAGAVIRFLTTYVATRKGHWLLTGTDRLKQRPIGPLVEVLRRLGARVEYLGRDGYPPLLVEGNEIRGGMVELNSEQSSQYASSLVMAAPCWDEGLVLKLANNSTSMPYLDMTIAMMRDFGADVERNDAVVTVRPSLYHDITYEVSADWSSASYWYEAAAFSSACKLSLPRLHMHSLQGDVRVERMFAKLGVKTTAFNDGVILEKIIADNGIINADFLETPDLFPSLAATCVGLQRRGHFTGIRNLTLKESNRIIAMENELGKLGAVFRHKSDDEVELIPPDILPIFKDDNPIKFDVYDDHRVAMSLALLAMKVGAVSIDTPEVVKKSYPSFWSQMLKKHIVEIKS